MLFSNATNKNVKMTTDFCSMLRFSSVFQSGCDEDVIRNFSVTELHFACSRLSDVCLCSVFCLCCYVSGRVEELGDVVAVACGQQHCLALCASGHVFSWGAGNDGQLGVSLGSQSNNGYRPRQDHSLWNIQLYMHAVLRIF